jgi:hypothetical protein
MQTSFRVLSTGGGNSTQSIELDEFPSLAKLREIVEPHLSGAAMLPVRVLHPDMRTGEIVDMFVDAAALFKRLPLNVEATRLYRAAHLRFHPEDDPDELPSIAGVAVVFMRRVIDVRGVLAAPARRRGEMQHRGIFDAPPGADLTDNRFC